MKPVLYPANATSYNSNGIGRLEPTSCIVVEERNGQYELSCTVPVDSPHFDDIRNNMILAVVPSDGATVQAFRIYQITEPLDGLVTISARHISYDLSYNTVMPFTASTCAAALLGLNTYAVETQPFTFWTDKNVSANFKVSTPQPIRACLGGQQGSVLDVYGGVYEWDNWTVKLWNQRGSDNGVTLRYGKNITDLSQEQNLESVVTGIVPYWASEDTVVTLPEKSVDSTYASQYPYKRTVPVDFSSDWDSAPTAAQLRARAQAYIIANNIGLPKVSIKVSFVALWQTEEYKDIAPLERVHLCDTVHIVFDRYGIDASAQVVRTEWDCLTERYLSIELGEARSNLASTLVKMDEHTEQMISDSLSDLQKAIDRATDIITGQNGGYLKINSDDSDRPYELLIMDQPAQADAQKLWRWNLGGLGYSKTGYAGPYGTAITMDGEIVADYITTGKLTADVIQAGILTDLAGKFSLDMVTGALTMASGTFNGEVITERDVTVTKPLGGTFVETRRSTVDAGSVQIAAKSQYTSDVFENLAIISVPDDRHTTPRAIFTHPQTGAASGVSVLDDSVVVGDARDGVYGTDTWGATIKVLRNGTIFMGTENDQDLRITLDTNSNLIIKTGYGGSDPAYTCYTGNVSIGGTNLHFEHGLLVGVS